MLCETKWTKDLMLCLDLRFLCRFSYVDTYITLYIQHFIGEMNLILQL